MDPLNLEGLPGDALVLVDTAPIIHVLEDHPRFARRFRPVFEAHDAGVLRVAITTITIIEVMTGIERAQLAANPDDDRDAGLGTRHSELASRYAEVFHSWRIVGLDDAIASRAARLRARYRLQLPDAVQAASALAINADALVTHDRDFSRLESRLSLMRVLS